MNFNYDLIMQENTVVHCDTEEKANELFKWADSKGLKWGGGNSYLDSNYWSFYKEQTCYDLYHGKYYPKRYYEKENYTILKYEDVIKASDMTREQFEAKLNVGECCSGFSDNYDCSIYSCDNCPLSEEKSEKEIRDWMNLEEDSSIHLHDNNSTSFGLGNCRVYDGEAFTIQANTIYTADIWEKTINTTNKTENEMNYKTIKSLKETKFLIDAKGLESDDIEIRTDNKDNKLYVSTVSTDKLSTTDEWKTELDLEFDYEIDIESKYNVDITFSKLDKGILEIVVPVQKDRIGSVIIG